MVKKIKRPNGKGSISRTRRRAGIYYQVRVKDVITGKRTSLGYYQSYNEARRILEDFIIRPWELDRETLTVKELYRQFIRAKKSDSITENTIKGYEYSFKRCRPLHNEKIKDITKAQVKLFINSLLKNTGEKASRGTKAQTKTFLYNLFEFGKDNNLIHSNPAKFDLKAKVNEPKAVERKEVFSGEEIRRLWENVNEYDWIDVILIMIYTGYRIGEILKIRKSDVDLMNWVIKGGGKTNKGRNRIIPVAEKIRGLVLKRYEDSTTDYLIDNRNWKIKAEKMEGRPVRENFFREKFYEVMNHLGMNHKPHDTRKTLATILSRNGINESVITDIMGHTDIKVTEKYYIKNDTATLKQAIERINDTN